MKKFKEWHKDNGYDEKGKLRTFEDILGDEKTPTFVHEMAGADDFKTKQIKRYIFDRSRKVKIKPDKK